MGASQQAGLADKRREALAEASGEVLEIGAGTGLNLAAYPRQGITRLVCTEPDRAMSRQLEARSSDAPVAVEVVAASAEKLPFADDSFDCVTGTLVLCEASSPKAALAEIARVLRPGGRYLFLEHVRSSDADHARMQDRWAPLWRLMAGGCNCNRDTLATISGSPLTVDRAEVGRFPKAPKIVKPLLIGSASMPRP
ncbi:MAG: methyltransferase domain-containing protein [Actinobacteria bacterium]|nr:methyltransferase domain-containing protein [Actinomycetota bacterium]MSX11006.1 methyltransferase domain-containing protein [Actinomycetota bacterium]